ncbi:hypothetical protein [Microvirga solisilvae]|uniref:hypothetical protein n=1 Tax=Microvirga solisilvae TaxID=2919498 RepID=UPI001FAF6EA2|nr:hypothetical protein [Microvirga solisilvae]
MATEDDLPPVVLTTDSAGGFPFTCKNALSSAPIPITDWTFQGHMRATESSAVIAAKLTSPGTISIVDGAAGKAQVLFLPEHTKRLAPGRYVFDVFRETPLPRQRLFRREIILKQAITRP